MDKKILITGASGLLGWNFCQWVKTKYQTFGVVHQNPFQMSGVRLVRMDLSDVSKIAPLVRKIAPQAIVHMASYSAPNFCQENPDQSAKLNVDASVALAELAAEFGAQFVFTSSDLVFDGKRGNYTELDDVNPVNIYGEQKAQAEAEILKSHPQACVCRMPLMFGESGSGAQSFLQGVAEALAADQKAKLFTDEFRTPAHVKVAVQGLELVLNKNISGLLHLGGKERLSRYEMGLQAAEVLGLDADQIVAAKQTEVPMAAPRPADVSLNSQKAFDLGYNPMNFREELKMMEGPPPEMA